MPRKRPFRNSSLSSARNGKTNVDTDLNEDGDSSMDLDVSADGNGSRELRDMEENLRASMAVDVGLRKGQKQQRLAREFEAQVRELVDQIEERVEEDKGVSKRVQAGQLACLFALSKRKADVENQIIRHVRELADAYEVVKGEFEAVLQGRSEDVHEAINALNGLEQRSSPK